MSRKFRLSPNALNDLESIGRYTQKRWGRAQREVYLRDLDSRFAVLAEQPLLGRLRHDIAPDYRSVPHKSHMIFYIVRDDGIDIIGLPHQAMDLRGYFTVT